MYMRYYLDNNGKRVYTLQYLNKEGDYTHSAHPARFSPDDKFSHERIICKTRFNLMITGGNTDKK